MQTRQLVPQPRQFVDDRIGLASIARLDVAALVGRRGILRELRDQHSELGFDLREAHALPLPAGGGVAFSLFGRMHVRLELRLSRRELFAFASRVLELFVSRGDATVKAVNVRVKRAGLFDQSDDLRQHLFTRQSATLAVLVEHAESRARAATFGSKRGRTLAQFGSPRVGRRLRRFGTSDLLADARQLRLECDAFLVAALGRRFLAFVLALELAGARGAYSQFRRRRACTLQLASGTLDLRGEAGRLRLQPDELRFDSTLPLAGGIPRTDRRIGAQMCVAQTVFGFFEVPTHSDERLAQAGGLKATR